MAELFAKVARPAILAAARSQGLRRTAERLPLTRDVVHRFVPGDTIADALKSVGTLRSSGQMVSIDYLGEDVIDLDAACANMGAYLGLLDALGRRPDASFVGVRPLEVSLKLSALGQALPRDGEKIALENAQTVCAAAERAGAWVTIDAEDHTTTDSTLRIVRALRADFGWVGTVLQAYLRRTYDDCGEFAGSGARIRLCKGAYDEPASVAFRDRGDVTDNYLRCLQVLMAGSGYPMVASHDPVVIAAAGELAQQTSRGPREFEYQMLYGIRVPEQHGLVAGGKRVRVYVPFGSQWYGYFVRRLAERPANVTFFLRALADRQHRRD